MKNHRQFCLNDGEFPHEGKKFQSDLTKTLHRLLDLLAGLAVLGVAVASLRTVQLGDDVFLWSAMIVIAAAMTTLFFRAEKYLVPRGLFLIVIYLAAIGFGIVKLGLATPGLYAIPFFVGFGALTLNFCALVALIASITILLGIAAAYHVLGKPDTLNLPVAAWNGNPRNWFVAILSVAVLSSLTAYLIKGLTGFWSEADKRERLTRQQLEALVEFAPDAIFLIDHDTRQILSGNEKAKNLFGIADKAITTIDDFETLSPERQPSGEISEELGLRYAKTAVREGRCHFEWVHQNQDGEPMTCEVDLSRIPPMNLQLLRASIRDISERLAEEKEREDLRQQLSASQRREMIGQLTGGIAHDFNNLLAVVLGNLELSKEEADDQKREAMIDASIEAALRGADLTRNMLAFARQAPLQPRIVDLNKIVRDTKNWSSRTVPANIQVETSLLARLWKVKVDPTNTESALLNLIVNARDAMPDGGFLTIETSNVLLTRLIWIAGKKSSRRGVM